MKKSFKYITMSAAIAAMGFASCSDVLEEQPRGIFEPGFFQTQEGLAGGLTSLYQNLRYLYGNMYYYQSLETGTDEYTYAQSADNNWKDADMSGVGNVTSESMRSDALWYNAFRNINTANSLIEYGKDSDPKTLAEAYFFRAFYYFQLVQTFGGVPLDMGSGELKPNTSTARFSKRNTVPEVYNVIFSDLEKAVENLPDAPRYAGTVSKNTARLFLSKAYLTFAWWLENPKGIATYPTCDRKDLNGISASQFFQMAYDVALDGINNPGPYKLMPTFRDLWLAQNDRANTEHMLVADRTESNEFYNGGNLGYGGNADGTDNNAAWATTWNYELVRNYKKENGEWVRDDASKAIVKDKSIHREAAQDYGRPWTRMCPTQDALAYFDNRDQDSRYDASFITAYRGNWDRGGWKNVEFFVDTIDANPIKPGEIVALFTRDEVEDVVYPDDNGESAVAFGKKAGVPYWICTPDHVSRLTHPALWKYGTYRTDNNGGLGSPNGALTRPFPICRFAELYFVAAEAAVKGASGSMSAAQLINVVRARAGKWNYDAVEGAAVDRDFSEDLAVTDVDLDFILDERAREFFGESLRWYDLVRTQTWTERASKYTIMDMGDKGAYNKLKTITRDIKSHYWLRPIPLNTLNKFEMTAEEKAAYQNPGY